jgi:hypothetical protein
MGRSRAVARDLTQAGWNDLAIAGDDAARALGKDGFEPLDGDGRDKRRARRAFYGFLVHSLDDWGAGHVDSMAGKLAWFYLHLTAGEAKHLVESARRHGVVRRVGDPKNVHGTEVDPQWIPTERGLKLALPRGASTGDLWNATLAIVDQIRVAFKDSWALLVLIAGLFSIQLATGDTLGGWLILAIGVIICALVLGVGLSGELDLKAMAMSWPRLEVYRPARYVWQTSTLRPWLEFVTRLGLAAGAGVTILAGANEWDWWPVGLVATALFGVITYVVYRIKVRPIRKLWEAEVARVFAHWNGDDG